MSEQPLSEEEKLNKLRNEAHLEVEATGQHLSSEGTGIYRISRVLGLPRTNAMYAAVKIDNIGERQ